MAGRLTRVIRQTESSSVEDPLCRRALEELGVPSLKLNVRGNRAYPDRLFFVPGGRPTLIELKRAGDEPRPLQLHVMDMLRRFGYDVAWFDDESAAFLHLAGAVEAARRAEEDDEVSDRTRRRLDPRRPRDR